jgi:hypothetical protein
MLNRADAETLKDGHHRGDDQLVDLGQRDVPFVGLSCSALHWVGETELHQYFLKQYG